MGGECCEFVAAQTSRDAVASGPCGEAGADRSESGVAGGMTKVVVESLEVVGVREDQDHVVRAALEEALGAVGEDLASPGSGQGVALGVGEAAVEDGGVKGPAGQWHGGRGDVERLPG